MLAIYTLIVFNVYALNVCVDVVESGKEMHFQTTKRKPIIRGFPLVFVCSLNKSFAPYNSQTISMVTHSSVFILISVAHSTHHLTDAHIQSTNNIKKF